MPRVEALWRECAELGAMPGLLVVPDWHGTAPVENHPAFADWVRARADEGAEIFLHGERHDEVGLPRRWRDEIRALGRTNREGEFLTLEYTGARDRIDRGLERLRMLGLEPIGFVPPAWLARLAAADAFGSLGLNRREALWKVLATGDDLPLFVGLEQGYPFAPVHEAIHRFCLVAGIQHYDLLADFRGRRSAELWVHPVDHHPNEIAHRLAAESLAPVVLKLAGP